MIFYAETISNRTGRGNRRDFAQCDVQGGIGERACHHSPYLRKDEDELHQDSPRRQGEGGNVTLRFIKGKNFFQIQIKSQDNESKGIHQETKRGLQDRKAQRPSLCNLQKES